MTRTLCLGNNTEHTDQLTRDLARDRGQFCHGLLSDLERPVLADHFAHAGFYHSSVYDLSWARLLELAQQFDHVIMLDQPKPLWSHPNAWLNTIRLIKKLGTIGEFANAKSIQDVEYWLDLLDRNQAFCIHPFIQLHTRYDHTVVCCRSGQPVADLKTFNNFATDANYRSLREKILHGQKISNCEHCYSLEKNNIVSDRIQDTIEWVNRLELKTVDDLQSISQPAFYDIRPSNKCNLTCRMCRPSDSHLIEKEYRQLGLLVQEENLRMHHPRFDMIRYDNLHQVYVAGGEPTVVAEVLQWLDLCVHTGHTNFTIEFNTNGTNITAKLKKLLPHFKQFNFIFSIDAYGPLNTYIRWPSDWHTVVNNLHYLRQQEHAVTLNTTISIYNISCLSLLFEFLDEAFPGILVHPSLVSTPFHMSPYLFPYADIVLKDLDRVKNTYTYQNLESMRTVIDNLAVFYNQNPPVDKQKLKQFFSMNDKLDQSRGVCLADYLPELDRARQLL
jgi:hypothetical protein